MGAYPRDTGSNPVEGNGHFFPSYRQLYLSSFFDTHTHTHKKIDLKNIMHMLGYLGLIRRWPVSHWKERRNLKGKFGGK